jgi:diguanylate cyclase (GGDEF)-like protein
LTQKQKKLLFNKYFLPITILLVLLAGFFIYASKVDARIFVLLVFLQIVSLPFLIYFRSFLENEFTSIKLKKEEYFEQVNLLSLDIEKENLAQHSLFERIEAYSKLKSLAEKLSLCSSCAEAAGILTERTDELFGRHDATTILYLFHPKTGQLGLVAAMKSGVKADIRHKKGDAFDHWIIKNLKSLLIENIKNDFRFDAEKSALQEEERLKSSLIAVPLTVGNKVLGILRVDSPDENRFAVDDLRFLSRIADLGAVALESSQLYEHIQDLAIKDSLTGLYLRRYLMDRLIEELPRQLRRKKDLSFLMMDLDHFKDYNDRFGHVAGDIVLRKLSEILDKNFKKPGNIICRYGGEEFAVMLPDCSKEEAHQLAEDFRKDVERTEVVLRREKTSVTISVGIASFPLEAQIKEELIHKADQALYQAKRKGRNRVC